MSAAGDSSMQAVGAANVLASFIAAGETNAIFVSPAPTPSGIPGGKGDSAENEEILRYRAMIAAEARRIDVDDQDIVDAMRVMVEFLTDRRL